MTFKRYRIYLVSFLRILFKNIKNIISVFFENYSSLIFMFFCVLHVFQNKEK